MTTEYYNGVICPMDLEPLDIEHEYDLTTTSLTITENGTTTLTPPIDKDAFSEITITTNVPTPEVPPFQINAVYLPQINKIYPFKSFIKPTETTPLPGENKWLLIGTADYNSTIYIRRNFTSTSGTVANDKNWYKFVTETIPPNDYGDDIYGTNVSESEPFTPSDESFWNTHFKIYLRNGALTGYNLPKNTFVDLPN